MLATTFRAHYSILWDGGMLPSIFWIYAKQMWWWVMLNRETEMQMNNSLTFYSGIVDDRQSWIRQWHWWFGAIFGAYPISSGGLQHRWFPGAEDPGQIPEVRHHRSIWTENWRARCGQFALWRMRFEIEIKKLCLIFLIFVVVAGNHEHWQSLHPGRGPIGAERGSATEKPRRGYNHSTVSLRLRRRPDYRGQRWTTHQRHRWRTFTFVSVQWTKSTWSRQTGRRIPNHHRQSCRSWSSDCASISIDQIRWRYHHLVWQKRQNGSLERGANIHGPECRARFFTHRIPYSVIIPSQLHYIFRQKNSRWAKTMETVHGHVGKIHCRPFEHSYAKRWMQFRWMSIR